MKEEDNGEEDMVKQGGREGKGKVGIGGNNKGGGGVTKKRKRCRGGGGLIRLPEAEDAVMAYYHKVMLFYHTWFFGAQGHSGQRSSCFPTLLSYKHTRTHTEIIIQ